MRIASHPRVLCGRARKRCNAEQQRHRIQEQIQYIAAWKALLKDKASDNYSGVTFSGEAIRRKI
jgi:hypothetical protein